MAKARVPGSLIDNEYQTFPKGFYDGDIASAEIRDPRNDGSWLSLELGMENVTPKEGTEDPGRSSFSTGITISTDGVHVTEVEDFSNGELPFAIRRAGALLAGLAEGLQVTTRDDSGVVEVDIEAVVNALTSGEFEGDRVGFQVDHYSPKNSDKTYEQYNRFGHAS